MIPMDGPITMGIEAARDHFRDALAGFALALLDVIKDISFTVALIGGGICIIVYAVTGIRRAGKIGGLLVLIHVLIRVLIGGAA
jgi:hypothetical membrane protein